MLSATGLPSTTGFGKTGAKPKLALHSSSYSRTLASPLVAQLQFHPLLLLHLLQVTTLMVMNVALNQPITVMEAVIVAGHGHLMIQLSGLPPTLPADANTDVYLPN